MDEIFEFEGFDGPEGSSNSLPLTESPSRLGILDRLKIASVVAKYELSRTTPPPTVIEIIGEKGTSIVVKDLYDSAAGITYFVIYRNADNTHSPMIKVPQDKFRSVYFEDLYDCRVFVMTKLVRVFFRECNSCQISLRQPIVGMAEFYKCKDTNINIRIPVDDDSDNPPIPLTRIEDCRDFHIFQSNNDLVYVVKLCESVTGTIICPYSKKREATYNLGKLFWNVEEQNLVCLSRKDGFGIVPMTYNLNNIDQIIFMDPQKESKDDMAIFGTTPTIAKTPFYRNQ
uniref:Uncharacterized protein n=1 Tax=Marseillevirus LCMAC101 TaxID=2506602 RepID=A0A481YTE5_9VIRU|nr:MAG: hypothetical protein LCMAC101_07820 [Marseillevirus LCMAC101]